MAGSSVHELRRSFLRAQLAGDAAAAERALRRALAAVLTAAQIDVELIDRAV